MLKYLLRPFVLFFKAALVLVLSVLLVLRRPILIILALSLSGLIVVMTILLIAYYQGEDVYNLDLDTYLSNTGSLVMVLSLLALAAIFWLMLEWVVPDGKNRPQEEHDKLQGGVVLPMLRRKKLQDTFVWKTKKRRKAIRVSSPCQGIYIEGSAGAGKSQSVVEPIIYQAAEQGYAGFLYDFKGHPPTLSSTLYGALSKHNSGVHFAHINLADPAISHRCNPLSPAYLSTRLYAQEYASIILFNRQEAPKR